MLQCNVQRRQGLVDQLRPIIKRHDCHLRHCPIGKHPFGQTHLNFPDFLLDSINNRQWIFSIAGNDHAADGFDAVFVQYAPSFCRSDRHKCNIFDRQRHAIIHPNDCLLDILNGADVSQTSNDILNGIDFNRTGTDIQIAFAHRIHNFLQRDPRRSNRFRFQLNLVFFHIATYGSNFSYPFDRKQCIADIEILNGAQLV